MPDNLARGLGSRDPAIFHDNLDEKKTREQIESLACSFKPVSLANLQTNSYHLTDQDTSFLNSVFGVPLCSSSYRSNGIEAFIIIFVFLLIIGFLFFCGPASILLSWIFWVAIIVIFIAIICACKYWRACSDPCTNVCQA